jgi:hypothetical protein
MLLSAVLRMRVFLVALVMLGSPRSPPLFHDAEGGVGKPGLLSSTQTRHIQRCQEKDNQLQSTSRVISGNVAHIWLWFFMTKNKNGHIS